METNEELIKRIDEQSLLIKQLSERVCQLAGKLDPINMNLVKPIISKADIDESCCSSRPKQDQEDEL